jgi:hypothetical protein
MTEPEPTFSRRLAHPDRRKVAAVAGACLAIVVSAAVAMGASPGPSTGTAAASPAASAAASTAPDENAAPGDHGTWPGPAGGPFDGKLGLGFGPGRLGGVEITSISGSSLSLKTVDGWTRTIEVTSATEITKGGDTITMSDLAVGDSIRFRQQRNDDGTFTITRIDVVQPTVAGQVTATTDSTITIELRGGTSTTVHVDSSTTIRVEGVDGTAKIGDVAVGMRIIASGEQRSDGSLDASRVLAGTGRKIRGDHQDKNAPNASPAPSSSANPG